MACTTVVVAVFAASRLTTSLQQQPTGARNPRAEAGSRLGDYGSRTDSSSAEIDAGDQDGPGTSDGPDPIAAAFDLLDDLLGPDDPGQGDQGDGDAWVTTEGADANGAQWSLTHPSDWEVAEVDPNLTTFSASDHPNVALVMVESSDGHIEDQAMRELDALSVSLADIEILTSDAFDFNGRDAFRTEVRYTHPGGQRVDALIFWIRDGDTTFLVAGEADTDSRKMKAIVEEALSSFAIASIV